MPTRFTFIYRTWIWTVWLSWPKLLVSQPTTVLSDRCTICARNCLGLCFLRTHLASTWRTAGQSTTISNKDTLRLLARYWQRCGATWSLMIIQWKLNMCGKHFALQISWKEHKLVFKKKMAIILPTGQWYAPSAVIKHAWYCMVFHGIALYDMVLHGFERYCMALHGIAWYCMAHHGFA